MSELKTQFNLDISQFVANLQNASSKLSGFTSELSKMKDVKLNVDVGGKVASDSISGLSAAFKSMETAATSSVNETKKALAQMIVSGKEGSAEFKKMETELKASTAVSKQLDEALKKVDKSVGDLHQKSAQGESLGHKAFGMMAAIEVTHRVSEAFEQVIAVGEKFEHNLLAVGAFTGTSGEALEKLGDKARDLGKSFASTGDASQQLEVFSAVLSKMGPAYGQNADAMELFARNANVMAKAGGIDVATSVNAMTNAMLQFGLRTGDANKDAETSTMVINALAASARAGAAQIPQAAESLLQVGAAAKGANMDIKDTLAGIQVMSLGGKTGAEAGVALRNVIGMMQRTSAEGAGALQKMGISSRELAQTLTEKGLGSAIELLRTGMSGLASDTERNQARMALFGMENAQAADILMSNIGRYKEFQGAIQDGTKGIGTAFEMYNQKAGTASSTTATLMAYVKDVFISGFQAMGKPLQTVMMTTTQIAPMVMTFATLGPVINHLGVSLLTKFIPSLILTNATTGVSTISFGAMGTAIWGAATAMWAALAPLLPFIAAAALLGVAVYALAGGFSKSTESKIKDAEASEKLIDKQIAHTKQTKAVNDSNIKLIDSWKAIGEEYQKTGKGADEYNKKTKELQAIYPDIISGTENFGKNLKTVSEHAEKAKTEVSLYDDKIRDLTSRKNATIELKVKLELEKAVEEFVDDVKGELNQKWYQKSFWDIIGTSKASKDTKLIESLIENVNKATNATAVKKAYDILWDTIDANQAGLSDTAKGRELERANKLQEQKLQQLENAKKKELKVEKDAGKNVVNWYEQFSKQIKNTKIGIDEGTIDNTSKAFKMQMKKLKEDITKESTLQKGQKITLKTEIEALMPKKEKGAGKSKDETAEVESFIREQENARLKIIDETEGIVFEQRIKSLESQKESTLNNTTLTESQRAKIISKYDEQILLMKQSKERQALDDKYSQEERALQAAFDKELEKENLKPEQIEAIEKERYDKLLALNDKYSEEIKVKNRTDLTAQEKLEIDSLKKIQDGKVKDLDNELKLIKLNSDAQIAEYKRIALEKLKLEYSDVSGGIKGEGTPLQLERYQQYQDKLKELDFKASEARVKLVTNEDEQKYKLELLNAQKAYNEQIDGLSENDERRLQLTENFLLKEQQLTIDYYKKTNSIIAGVFAFREALQEAFTNTEKEAKQKELEDSKKEIDKQQEELEKQLSTDKISYQEYTKQLDDLNKKRTDAEKKAAEDKYTFLDNINRALVASFKTMMDMQESILIRSLNKMASKIQLLNNTFMDLSIGDLLKENSKALYEFAAAALVMTAEAGAKALVTGKNVGSAMLGILFDSVTSAVNILGTQILAGKIAAYAELPGVGTAIAIAEWTGIMVLLNTLLAAGKSLVIGGAETGFMPGEQVGTKGVSDTQLIWKNPNEAIIPERETRNEIAILKHIRKGGTSEEYFNKVYLPGVLKDSKIDLSSSLNPQFSINKEGTNSLLSEMNSNLIAIKEKTNGYVERTAVEIAMEPLTANGDDFYSTMEKIRKKGISRW
jgi:TP901 family phage tail tape measure protein